MNFSSLLRQKTFTSLCSINKPSSLCNKSNVPFPLFLLHFSTLPRPTVSDFLLHKHNFSPEAASQVASVLTRLRNPEKSDTVLSFLKEIGFSKTLVEKIVKSRPGLLSANIEKTIKPRIKIFQDLGFSPDGIAKVVSNDPWILRKSTSHLVTNVEFLKSCGVTMEQIIWAMCYFRRFISSKPEHMKKFVDKVDEFGVSRHSKMFIHAVRIVSSMNETTLEQKLTIFQDFGFSDDEIRAAFRKAPLVFGVSEEKIRGVKEVILGTGKYEMANIVSNPIAFMYSVEKRYKPRIKVLEVLESKGVIERWPCFATLCRLSDKKFYEKFVGPYLDAVEGLNVGSSLVSGNSS